MRNRRTEALYLPHAAIDHHRWYMWGGLRLSGLREASLKSIKSFGPINLNHFLKSVRQIKTFHSAMT
jgi:hypothetical protein